MVRDGIPIILWLLVIAAALFLAGVFFYQPIVILAFIVAALGAFVAYFFRDPERTPPAGDDLILSPADGRVVVIEPLNENETLLSIFLSVFDVHVNRAPIAGTVVGVEYREGRFMVANDKRASVENEQNVVTIENSHVRVIFKQIAGLIARRIVFWKQLGSSVAGGEKVGLIKFGSRVDVIMPRSVTVSVKVGDHVEGGLTIIGRISR